MSKFKSSSTLKWKSLLYSEILFSTDHLHISNCFIRNVTQKTKNASAPENQVLEKGGGSSGAHNRLSRRPCSPVQYHDNNYSHSVTKGRHGGRDSCCRNGRTRRLRCEASSSSNLSTRDRVLKGTALVRAGKLKEAVRELEPLIEGKKTEKKTEEEERAASL